MISLKLEKKMGGVGVECTKEKSALSLIQERSSRSPAFRAGESIAYPQIWEVLHTL
jgi:hypothetical protein